MSHLTFVKENWKLFPLNTIYVTSESNKLLLEEKDKIYLYSIHRIEDIRLEKLDINSTFFTIHKVISNDLNLTIGYIFRVINERAKIRYTPICLTATTPECTKKSVDTAERKILYSDNIYILWFSCNAEMITFLPTILGIHPL